MYIINSPALLANNKNPPQGDQIFLFLNTVLEDDYYY
jgi:hypothetical protein